MAGKTTKRRPTKRAPAVPDSPRVFSTVPRELRITSWLELAALAAVCANERWIFRGETRRLYGNSIVQVPLQPKAGRVGRDGRAERKEPHKVAHERKALEDFVRQARPHIGHTPASPLEWLAIAQHHGMWTRLLDWSESLLVAAYFATVEANTAVGIIYAVQGLRVVNGADARKPFDLKEVGIYHPPHISPRIPAQRSVFTVHPDPTADFKPQSLCEWRVAPLACLEIKQVLDACAINENSLFPDLDGLSRYIGWRYKWGKF